MSTSLKGAGTPSLAQLIFALCRLFLFPLLLASLRVHSRPLLSLRLPPTPSSSAAQGVPDGCARPREPARGAPVPRRGTHSEPTPAEAALHLGATGEARATGCLLGAEGARAAAAAHGGRSRTEQTKARVMQSGRVFLTGSSLLPVSLCSAAQPCGPCGGCVERYGQPGAQSQIVSRCMLHATPVRGDRLSMQQAQHLIFVVLPKSCAAAVSRAAEAERLDTEGRYGLPAGCAQQGMIL